MALSSRPGFPGLAILASVLLLATPATAERATWDQARVSEIAQQLASACNAWQQAVREQPGEDLGSGMAQGEFGLLQTAQVLQEQSEALAAHLAHGKGYEDTHGMYESLKEMTDDTQVRVQETDLDEPAQDAWSKVSDLMRQIAPYYDAKADRETDEEGSR